MPETPQQYTQRMLSYTDKKEPLAMQQAAPKKLAALLRGKTKRQLTRRPAPGKWSVAEILAHLADAEVAISWRLRQIVSSNGVAIQAFDQDAWAATMDYQHRDPKQSLDTYRALRETNIAVLKSISKELWANYGVHQERGNESISHIVSMTAGHDVNHFLQAQKILKKAR